MLSTTKYFRKRRSQTGISTVRFDILNITILDNTLRNALVNYDRCEQGRSREITGILGNQ